MNDIAKLLRKNNLTAIKYEKKGNVTIVTTNRGKYVLKKSCINKKIKDYLKDRNFDYIPKIIYENDYTISQFVSEREVLNEQKIIDLAELIALLHTKTTHYKEVEPAYFMKLYEDLNNNLEYLYTYYTDIINIIESKVYMSPSEYLFAKNINVIYSSLDVCYEMLEDFYKNVENKNKQRFAILHNNLDLKHFLKDDRPYLISWEKAKIDNPIFDMYKLYNKYSLEFDFEEILKKYENIYPLLEEEKLLLFILILMPSIITFNKSEYQMCIEVNNEIEKEEKTKKIVLPYYTKYRKHQKQKENE